MTDPPGRWNLDVRPRAQRQIERLPEKVATAAVEFILGPLLENPHRVGHPLHEEYEGEHSARRGPWRIRYRISDASLMVVILDLSHRSDVYGV